LSSLLADSPTGFVIQPSHPGYAYLGLGVIGLTIVAAVIHRQRLVAVVQANQMLAVAVLALLAWAVSPWLRLTTGDPLDIPNALAVRLGSPRRAGVAASTAGVVAATAVFLLVAGAAVGRRRPNSQRAVGGFTPAVVSAAALLLAASLVGLASPELIGVLMAQFRASGRFAWPAIYGLLTLAVAATDPARMSSSLRPAEADGLSPRTGSIGRFARVGSLWLLGVAVALQFADTATVRRLGHELLVPGGGERRDYVEALVDLVEAHDRVVLGPDFRCTYYPDGVGAFIDVTGAASAADRPIDRIYSARRPQTEPCAVPQAVDLSDPGALIVLVEPVAVLTEENDGQAIAERCRQRATLNVCSQRWADVSPEILAYFGPVAD
jgi:hypothetical protein